MIRVLFFLTLLNVLIINTRADIVLSNVKSSECKYDGDPYNFKNTIKLMWINDTVLSIQTKTSSNCIGVYQPRAKLIGPLVCLYYNDIADNGITANCNCLFQINWTIKGLKKDSDFIVLVNGKLSYDYSKQLLYKLLTKYEIEDNTLNFHLINSIDKNGLKQGDHFVDEDSVSYYQLYHNGEKIKR